MPLIKSKSSKAVGKNIAKEQEAGKPHKQAIAIALEVQRRAKQHKAHGGEVHPDHPMGADGVCMAHGGACGYAEGGQVPPAPIDGQTYAERFQKGFLGHKAEGGMVEDHPDFDSESMHQPHHILGLIIDSLKSKKKKS